MGWLDRWTERDNSVEAQTARNARLLAVVAAQNAEIRRRQEFAEVLVEVLRAAVRLQNGAEKRRGR